MKNLPMIKDSIKLIKELMKIIDFSGLSDRTEPDKNSFITCKNELENSVAKGSIKTNKNSIHVKFCVT